MPYVVPDAVREPLYVIVPYQNCWRWKSREKHTLRAIKHFADSGAVVVLVEAAFNRREFTFANSGLDGTLASCSVIGADHNFRHKYIPLRSTSELWLKESLINAAVAQLPYDWQQVAWIDSDVVFVRPNWVRRVHPQAPTLLLLADVQPSSRSESKLRDAAAGLPARGRRESSCRRI